jgi:hypothetical protein
VTSPTYTIGHRYDGVSHLDLYRFERFTDADWAALNERLDPAVRVFAQTALVGQAAAGHFDGVYTYDVVGYGPDTFTRLCQQAHALDLLCAPSVGPGYDARASTGDPRVKPRRDGATYDTMWRCAIAARADLVTITSYNEWHEGTQIEPAAERPGYDSYAGAWGATGAAAESAYLERTAWWTSVFAGRTRP